MTVTLLDTGPLVAFLNRGDRYHSWAVAELGRLAPPLLTCEAVLSEATYLLRGRPGGPEAVLELVGRGVVSPSFRLADEAGAIGKLLKRYGRDLADACLVRMSELHPDCTVLTIDTEFRDVYRRHGRKAIPTRMPPGRSARR